MTLSGSVLVYIFVAGVAMTAIWRIAGLALSAGLSEDGLVIAWVKAVSTALVAGLIARIIVFPPGALAEISVTGRLVAFCVGVGVYFLAKRHMGLGVLLGSAALIAMHSIGA